MRYFSPVWDISTFQRTSHCMQNAGHASSSVETSPDTGKSQSFVDFVQIYALFLSDRDISSFKRSFHCIMRADRSASAFQRRNEPRHKPIAIIRRFCPNLCVVSLPLDIFRRFNAHLTACRTQGTPFLLSKQAQTHANSNNSAILTITIRYVSPI